MTLTLTDWVKQVFQRLLWTDGPTRKGNSTETQLITIIKQRLIHPGYGNLFLKWGGENEERER